MKVTTPNNDISSTNNRLFMADSNINMLKIEKEGSGTFEFSNPSVGDSITISHNLGYKPIVWYYVEHPELKYWFMANSRLDGSDWNITINYEHLDDNRVKFKVDGWPVGSLSSWDVEVKYKFFILVDPRKDSWYE